jgi:hypothetical protein
VVQINNAEYHRIAAANVLLDCFDRKVQREFFCSVLNDVLNFNEDIRRFELLSMLIVSLSSDKPVAPETMLELQVGGLASIEGYRVKILNEIRLLRQLPWEDDTVN